MKAFQRRKHDKTREHAETFVAFREPQASAADWDLLENKKVV